MYLLIIAKEEKLAAIRAVCDRETCCFESRVAANGSRGKGFALRPRAAVLCSVSAV